MTVKHIWASLSPHHASSTLLAVFLNHQVVKLRQITSGSATTYPPIFWTMEATLWMIFITEVPFLLEKISSEATSPWVLSFLMALKFTQNENPWHRWKWMIVFQIGFKLTSKTTTLWANRMMRNWTCAGSGRPNVYWGVFEEQLRTKWEKNQYWSSAIQQCIWYILGVYPPATRANLFIFLVGWVLFFLVTLRWNVDF